MEERQAGDDGGKHYEPQRNLCACIGNGGLRWCVRVNHVFRAEFREGKEGRTGENRGRSRTLVVVIAQDLPVVLSVVTLGA
jgi:hypothetical protein